MPKRLTHAAIAFAAVVVVYQLYELVAVPLLEPDWHSQALAGQPGSEQGEATRTVAGKYREVLSAYFPADHWSLQQPPKTFESGRVMIVLDDYHPRDNGQVRVDRCAILFFPKPRVRGAPPPRDAIVLEAPHGAVLQMDNSVRSGPVSLGKFQSGRLLGDITIRSDMREPGPKDDLYLSTRDLYMTEYFIRTDAKVDLRIGPHRGQGRVLELRLLPAAPAGGGLNIGGIDTLEVTHDVVAEIVPKDLGPPMQVTSRGPFTIDFTSFIASFTDQIEAVQIHADGQRDEVHGDELNFYFALGNESPTSGSEEAGGLPLSGIRPAMVELKGSPAVIDAPSRESAARCDRMRLQIDPQIATFDGQGEVMLSYRGSEIHAPMIQYTHGGSWEARGARREQEEIGPNQLASRVSRLPTRLGTLIAAGSGWLRAVAPARDQEESSQNQLVPRASRLATPFEVHWKESMRLGRRDGQPVLLLEGRPHVAMVGLGELWADKLDVYLRERKRGSNVLPADVVPDHMVATGRVAIDSTELTVRVHELAVWIDYELGVEGREAQGASYNNNSRLAPPNSRLPGALQQRAYGIAGNRLQMKLMVRDRQPEVTNVSVDGSVVFQELPVMSRLRNEKIPQSAIHNPQSREAQRLVIKASELRIEKADTPAAEIEIIGSPATSRHSAVDAQVSMRGMTIRTAAMKLKRDTSRVSIDSPGELEILVDRDLQGQPLAQPQPMKITWQKSMELNRDRITFLHDVVVQGSGGVLRTEQLGVRLSAPVRFDGAAGHRQPELVAIDCTDGVKAEFMQQDAGGTTSEQRMEMVSLMINQQTGEVQGSGPGWVEGWNLGVGSRGARIKIPSNSRLPTRVSQPLRYLQVKFQQGMRGNLHGRYVEVFGDVKAIYGPVDSWQQRLVRSRHDGPSKDTIWISSDTLRVGEDPMARVRRRELGGARRELKGSNSRLGPMQLRAEGRVVIEGRDPQRGEFTARGHRASYDQQKSMFVLEGDGRRPATLSHQQYPGSPPSENSARKITYWQSTGEVKIEGVSKLEWSQFDVERREPAASQRDARKSEARF